MELLAVSFADDDMLRQPVQQVGIGQSTPSEPAGQSTVTVSSIELLRRLHSSFGVRPVKKLPSKDNVSTTIIERDDESVRLAFLFPKMFDNTTRA